jgi:hypothetical protein
MDVDLLASVVAADQNLRAGIPRLDMSMDE